MLDNMKIKLKKLFYRLVSFFPTMMPIGMQQFNVWADRIIFTYDLPDNDSFRFALATMVLHADSEPRSFIGFLLGAPARKAPRYFGLKMKKAMANEIASGIMRVAKEKQQEAAKQSETGNKNE